MDEKQDEKPNNAEQSHYDDEISLVDLWLVLMRRKWIVLGITVFCLAIGTGYASRQPVMYEYRSGIELARIWDNTDRGRLELLSSRDGSMALLEDVIIPSQRNALLDGQGDEPRVRVSVRGDSHHLILSSAAMPEMENRVRNLHKAVARELEETHSSFLERDMSLRVKPFKARADMLQRLVEELESQLDHLSGRNHDGNDVFSLIDVQQMADIRRELAGVRVNLIDTTSAVEAIQEASHGTRLRFLGAQSENPVGTSKRLVVALSLVLGFMLGIFGAFFSEFLATARASTRK